MANVSILLQYIGDKMKIEIMTEHGYEEALYGLGLSYGLTSDISYDFWMEQDAHFSERFYRLEDLAIKLANKGDGHNKFLESIVVWMKIQAPRYLWQEADTYRVGMTKQSESTIHTITKRNLTQDDFSYPIPKEVLENLNGLIDLYRTSKSLEVFHLIKNNLPEGFLQRRIVCTNYKTLRNMAQQRKGHKLVEWKEFIYQLQKQLKRVELIGLERIR